MTGSKDDSAGIGVRLTSDSKELKVSEVFEGGPADKGGVKKGDIITHIDGKRMYGVGLEQAVTAMRGRSGTLVVLKVRGKRGDKEQVKAIKLSLIRDYSAYSSLKTSEGITVRSFPKQKAQERCPPKRDGCLFIVEQAGDCTYSCKDGKSE